MGLSERLGSRPGEVFKPPARVSRGPGQVGQSEGFSLALITIILLAYSLNTEVDDLDVHVFYFRVSFCLLVVPVHLLFFITAFLSPLRRAPR